MKTNRILLILLMASTLFTACKKSDSSHTPMTPVAVRITDAFTDVYTKVNIDVQGVEVITEKGHYEFTPIKPGIYNILNFANGKDTLIISDSIPTASISQIRLMLGSNNTVEINGSTYPLKTPSAQQSGLKLNVHADLVEGVAYVVTLDFDAGRSIVTTGSGDYILKPVIRLASTAISGSIHGSVTTSAALPVMVWAVMGDDTISTTTAADGQFLVRAVPAGTWQLTLRPVSPFIVVVQDNVTVSTGHVTEVGTITF